jgi:hypothetical protein
MELICARHLITLEEEDLIPPVEETLSPQRQPGPAVIINQPKNLTE